MFFLKKCQQQMKQNDKWYNTWHIFYFNTHKLIIMAQNSYITSCEAKYYAYWKFRRNLYYSFFFTDMGSIFEILDFDDDDVFFSEKKKKKWKLMTTIYFINLLVWVYMICPFLFSSHTSKININDDDLHIKQIYVFSFC